MGERTYQTLKYAAIVMAIAWVGWSLYEYLASRAPGDFAYHAASKFFADGDYEHALREYETALKQAPEHIPAMRGRAETLIMLKREPEAITVYAAILKLQPEYGGHYANLGIAYDRIGDYPKALENYEKALSLDEEVGDGPHWLTRFLRNQAEKPPGIAERVSYLKQQLALPEDQRVLRLPELDDAQRPYKK